MNTDKQYACVIKPNKPIVLRSKKWRIGLSLMTIENFSDTCEACRFFNKNQCLVWNKQVWILDSCQHWELNKS